MQPKAATRVQPRPLTEILVQPQCAAAVVTIVASYSIMLVLMAPTPAVMKELCSFLHGIHIDHDGKYVLPCLRPLL